MEININLKVLHANQISTAMPHLQMLPSHQSQHIVYYSISSTSTTGICPQGAGWDSHTAIDFISPQASDHQALVSVSLKPPKIETTIKIYAKFVLGLGCYRMTWNIIDRTHRTMQQKWHCWCMTAGLPRLLISGSQVRVLYRPLNMRIFRPT